MTGRRDVASQLPEYSAVRERLEELIPHEVSTAELAARFGSSAWVVDSVPLALCAASRIANSVLSDVLQDAIEAGGDTDTVASIAGQIAGAHVGGSAIADPLWRSVRGMDSVVRTAHRLADALSAST